MITLQLSAIKEVQKVKENEKNFLLDVLYRNLNRSEVDFYDCLYKINTHSDVNALYQAMISLVRYKTYSKVFRDVLDILSFSVFNDNERFKSKSQLFLANRVITQEQDDLIYNYIVYLLNTK